MACVPLPLTLSPATIHRSCAVAAPVQSQHLHVRLSRCRPVSHVHNRTGRFRANFSCFSVKTKSGVCCVPHDWRLRTRNRRYTPPFSPKKLHDIEPKIDEPRRKIIPVLFLRLILRPFWSNPHCLLVTCSLLHLKPP